MVTPFLLSSPWHMRKPQSSAKYDAAYETPLLPSGVKPNRSRLDSRGVRPRRLVGRQNFYGHPTEHLDVAWKNTQTTQHRQLSPPKALLAAFSDVLGLQMIASSTSRLDMQSKHSTLVGNAEAAGMSPRGLANSPCELLNQTGCPPLPRYLYRSSLESIQPQTTKALRATHPAGRFKSRSARRIIARRNFFLI